ncbi:MAG: hypothetical protein GXO18_07360 [Aquificae bacterium]|nr:hypothetical protein [Aquificota bacterium]
MYSLVFDIETVPVDEEELSREEIEYLYRRAQDEEKEKRIREMMGLWALTAHLVSVGLLVHEKGRAMVLYIGERNSEREEKVDGFEVKFRSFSISDGIENAEKRILQEFWSVVGKNSIGPIVSFNGRGFDSHFLMLRSLALNVKATRNLMGNRYDYNNHIDLLDLLSFHGAGRLYSLDFLCRRLGINTPKEFMKAEEVKERFKEGMFEDIALYNLYDVIAISKLYERVKGSLGEVLGI